MAGLVLGRPSFALYNLFMDAPKAPEFDLQRPIASGVAVLRNIFFAPMTFYRNFDAKGPVREPAVFVLLVSAVSGCLSVVANLVSQAAGVEAVDTSLLGVVAFNLAFILLSPVLVGVAAGAYLLSVRVFIGPAGNFREVYRMLAYAYGVLILLWVPVVYAFAFTYATMILMGLGIQSVYRTCFLTALVTTLAGFIPVSVALIYILLIVNRLVSG